MYQSVLTCIPHRILAVVAVVAGDDPPGEGGVAAPALLAALRLHLPVSPLAVCGEYNTSRGGKEKLRARDGLQTLWTHLPEERPRWRSRCIAGGRISPGQ